MCRTCAIYSSDVFGCGEIAQPNVSEASLPLCFSGAGTFDTAQEAHEAYVTARAGLRAAAGMGVAAGTPGGTKKHARRKQAEASHPVQPVAGLLGVLHDRDSGDFEAVVELPKRADDGSAVLATSGKYPTAEEAARAYDALARMYQGADAPTNFAVDVYAAFEPPTVEERRRRFEAKRGVALTPEEIEQALVAERAIDVRVLDLSGKVSGFRWLVVCSGRSVTHMRRLADMVFKAILDRRLHPGEELGDWGVEGRDSEDWMVVDCGGVVVNVFSEQGRAAYGIEQRYGAAAATAGGEASSGADDVSSDEQHGASDTDSWSGGDTSDDETDAEWEHSSDGQTGAVASQSISLEEAFRRFGPKAFEGIGVEPPADTESQSVIGRQSGDAVSAGDVAGTFDPATTQSPSGPNEALSQGASSTAAEQDSATRWVAANPIPQHWMDRTEQENSSVSVVDVDETADEQTAGWASQESVFGRSRV
jgi:ribosome-associated protein